MSLGRVLLGAGADEAKLFELDGLTVQALSALVYQFSKKENSLLRVQVFVDGCYRVFHLLPQLPLVFETDEDFEAVEVNERFQLLRDFVSADGLLKFDALGAPVEPLKKARQRINH